jgi:hypothetical protein
MTVNRLDIRKELAKLLIPHLTHAQGVYHYPISDLNKESPVVYMSSSSSQRVIVARERYNSIIVVNIHLIVLAGISGDLIYTAERSEEILDTLESELAEGLLHLGKSEIITSATYQSPSNADTPMILGGETYLHEIVPITVQSMS